MNDPKYFSLGDNALTVSFGNVISSPLNDLAVGLYRNFEKKPFAGMIETVPAYCSLSIFYDVYTVRKNFPGFPTAFEAVKNLVETALHSLENLRKNDSNPIKIPVNFSKECAPDLDFVASQNKLKIHQVIEIFTATTYRVFMIGFLLGFAYMGEVDEKIAAPRKKSPRLLVPKGSVGIAGRQTGIYPLESPGGWQIIGRTDFELFTPYAENPCALQAGDLVKFYALNK